jgi:phenylpyruvate tautomerase PptA (4-oxalocrotonate tautomerase family)
MDMLIIEINTLPAEGLTEKTPETIMVLLENKLKTEMGYPSVGFEIIWQEIKPRYYLSKGKISEGLRSDSHPVVVKIYSKMIKVPEVKEKLLNTIKETLIDELNILEQNIQIVLNEYQAQNLYFKRKL